MKRSNKIGLRFTIPVILLLWFGMRYVTQAGQGMDMPQNDGYAVAGAALILIAGIIIGLAWPRIKPISRKEVKNESDENFKNLNKYASNLKKNEGKK